MTTLPWDQVRAFALRLPRAIEDSPWEVSVIKVEHPPRRGDGPMFLWLGRADVPVPAVCV